MSEVKKQRATTWTDAKLEALKLPEGKREQRRRVDSGLYIFLRAKAKGGVSKQWQYRAQVDQARRWLSIGSYPAMGLARARIELLKHQAVQQAAKRGEADHPALVAKVSRRAASKEPTLDVVYGEWLEDKRLGSKRKGGKPVRERTIEILAENYNNYIKPRAGQFKATTLSRSIIQDSIDIPRRNGKAGAAAQVYRTWRGLINFAIKRGYIGGADPMRGIDNPKPYRPAPVNAANDAQIVALLKAIEGSRLSQSTRLAIEFQILTGARPTEVRLATLGEFQQGQRIWSIPADRVKSDRPFRVHLSEEALEVINQAKALPRLDGNKFVFPGIGDGPIEKMAVARALSRLAERIEKLGGKRLTPHDLRKTFRTMLARLGVQPHVAELCINHLEAETMRRIYDGHDYFGEMSQAWDKAGAHITALRSGGAQVIPLNIKSVA